MKIKLSHSNKEITKIISEIRGKKLYFKYGMMNRQMLKIFLLVH